jgi:DNA (cytosine-5)-methyltransferase 1
MTCPHCAADLSRLQAREPPEFASRWPKLTAVDLFSGFGGMTIGLSEAAADAKRRVHVALAVDDNQRAADAFSLNFDEARVETAKVETLIDGELGAPLSTKERRLRKEIGQVSILVGGPPCQGHSDLNNHTRREDGRNALYARMARAAVVLRPQAVVIENVPQVAHDRGNVVEITEGALQDAGYSVCTQVVHLEQVGVPQKRRRHVMLAVKRGLPSPDHLLEELDTQCADHPRTVSWAIEDLEGIEPISAFDRASVPSPLNRKRIATLFREDAHNLDNKDRPSCHRDKDHSYKAMYGRLYGDRPAQTITTGFGSMGQGRYVHPSRHRTITPHEAARLQTIPDYVKLSLDERRGAWAQMIGNAVPPFLTRALGKVLIPHLEPVDAP